jgi:hypothetical protein
MANHPARRSLSEILIHLQRLTNHRLSLVDQPEDLLQAFSTRVVLLDSIHRLLVDDALATSVANRSYEHVNGFDKIVLLETSNHQLKLRLHIWWPLRTENKRRFDAHNHCWDFWSLPLTGQFTNEMFEVGGDGRRMRHLAYSPRGGRAHFELRDLGIQSLRRVQCCTVLHNNTYFLNAHVIHRFYPVGKTVASTLVLQGPKIRAETDVFTPEQQTMRSTSVSSPSMSVDQLRVKIERYLLVTAQ